MPEHENTRLTVTNTLTYYDIAKNSAVKCFNVKALGGWITFFKSFKALMTEIIISERVSVRLLIEF
jgi:hypothetical protein